MCVPLYAKEFSVVSSHFSWLEKPHFDIIFQIHVYFFEDMNLINDMKIIRENVKYRVCKRTRYGNKWSGMIYK